MTFRKKILLLGAFLSFQYAPTVSAEIYKCKTASGDTTYSSEKCGNNSEVFTLKKENHVEQKPAENIPSVDIYITSWCPYCKKAMAYLKENNIAFNAYDIEKDAKAKAKKWKLDPSYSGVPLTVINGKLLKGFSPRRFGKALNL